MTGLNTPKPINNRPGLSSIAYRIGDYAAFRDRLLSLLGLDLVPGTSLEKLKTRDPGDGAIALLDAWAVLADVLTFYQERIANEGFLKTAIERQSVLQLARSIGYELKPGVAASTHLAFTIESPPDNSRQVKIDRGTQILSIPGEGEVPQTFETSEDLLAYVDWNAIKPRLSRPQIITRNTYQLYLEGTTPQLTEGDFVLLVGEVDQVEQQFLLRLKTITVVAAAAQTLITWEEQLPLSENTVLRNSQVFAFRQRAALFGSNAPRWQTIPNELKHAAGGTLRGGVYAAEIPTETNLDVSWKSASQGLPYQDILCLTTWKQYLFAGTANSGIFRSEDQGLTWKATNIGLTNFAIQAIYADADGNLLAGTPAGGVFQSKDQGESWSSIGIGSVRLVGNDDALKPVNTGLPNTNVRSFVAYQSGENSYIFAGTDNSVYRTLNQGQDWSSEKISTGVSNAPRLAGLPNKAVFSLAFIETKVEVTEIDANEPTKITVKVLSGVLRPNSIITSDTQSRKIRSINTVDESTRTLELNRAFFDPVEQGTKLSVKTLLAGTDKGLYFSTNDGKNWESIDTGESKIIYSIQVPSEESTNQIYLGTEQGLLYASDIEGTWAGIANDQLGEGENKIVRSIAIGKHQIFVATQQGVLRLEGTDSTNWEWVPVNTGLAAPEVTETEAETPETQPTIKPIKPEVTAIDVNTAGYIFAASRFAGFVEDDLPVVNNSADPDAQLKGEWASFQLQSELIDLDALYPKILPDSWIALLNPSQTADTSTSPIAIRKIVNLSTVQRKDYALDTKVTRIHPDRSVKESEAFPLRTTLVLAQSELLPLAQVKLTVPVQQNKIFFDPLTDNKIFLSQFIPGLHPQQALIVSGQSIQARANIGGVFRSKNWQQCASILDNETIQAVAIYAEDHLFIGTENGIFRSTDGGKTWQPMGNLIANVLLSQTKQETIGLSSLNTEVQVTDAERSSGFDFHRIVEVGDTITVNGQTRTVTAITSAKALEVDAGFSPDLLPALNPKLVVNKLFAGTHQGIFRLDATQLLKVNQTDFDPDEADQVWQPVGIDPEKENLHVTDNILTLAIQSTDTDYLLAGTGKKLLVFRFEATPPESATSIAQPWKLAKREEEIDALTIAPTPTEIWIGTGTNRVIQYGVEQGQQQEYFVFTQARAGRITGERTHRIIGKGTKFLSELTIGDRIAPINEDGNLITEYRVVTKIVSDSEIRVESPFDIAFDQVNFVIAPAVSRNGITGFVSYTKSETNYLFAATTDQGVFRSQDQGKTWRPVNNHLTDKDIRSLSFITDENQTLERAGFLFAATANNGVFASTNDGDAWFPINAGLTNLSVRSLVTQPDRKVLLAGTVAGVFHSTDVGRNWTHLSWEHINTGLTLTTVQTLITGEIDQQLYLFAGTKEGVFRSTDWGQSWEPISQGLTNLEVQTLLFLEETQSPDLSKAQSLWAGTKNGIFRSLDLGKSWQLIKIKSILPDIRALIRNPGADQALYAAIAQAGIYRSTDGGNTWNPAGLAKQEIRALTTHANNGTIYAGTMGNGIFFSSNNGAIWQRLTDTRSTVGTLSSEGALVTVSLAEADRQRFREEVQVGDTIVADGQSRKIVSVDYDALLITVDVAFKPALKAGTRFSVQTGLFNLNITALIVLSDTELLAATAGSGFFHSTDQGKRWQQVNQGLSDLEVRCLTYDAEPDAQTGQILAGTATQGVFRATYHIKNKQLLTANDSNEIWEALADGLTNTDVRALTFKQNNIYVGGIGILISPDGFDTTELNPGDLLQINAPPVPANPEQRQTWQVINRQGFKGVLNSIAPSDIQLYPASETDAIVSEICTVLMPPKDEQNPVLTLTQPLKHSYDPASVTIYGNVVKATHGETVTAILGSGDGTIPNQRFGLQKLPLTYVADATASGATSTLKVVVNDVEWTESPSLYPLKPIDQSYIIQIEDDGSTNLVFGDGERGARLPTGRENITVTYRAGIGLEGQVAAGSLSLKKTGPPSIVGVTNPLAASGAAPKESLAQAQVNAPSAVRTLDRIVSLRDFGDFVRTFAGIGKAQAVALWNGSTQIAHLTIASATGEPISPDSSLYQSLISAIDRARDPMQQVQVDSFEPLYFRLEARVVIDTRYQTEKVIDQIEAALLAKFAFDQRQFGQAVTASEVIATIQAVIGVKAVDLDALHRRGLSRTLQKSLPATTAVWDATNRRAQPAQLLLLQPTDIVLTPVTTL